LKAVEDIVVALKDIIEGTGVPDYATTAKQQTALTAENLNVIEEVPDQSSRSEKANFSVQEDEDGNLNNS